MKAVIRYASQDRLCDLLSGLFDRHSQTEAVQLARLSPLDFGGVSVEVDLPMLQDHMS